MSAKDRDRLKVLHAVSRRHSVQSIALRKEISQKIRVSYSLLAFTNRNRTQYYLDKKNPCIRAIIQSVSVGAFGRQLATKGNFMVRKLVSTDNNPATTILRLVLGVIFFAHGAQKMLGWFGGYGFTGTMGFFTGVMHIPALFAFLAIAAEFFGSLGLIFGFLTRIAAFGILCNMTVAVAMIHHHFGFFMNWSGAQKGEGYEYHLLAFAVTVFLMIRGAGAASIDRMLSSRTNDKVQVQVAR